MIHIYTFAFTQKFKSQQFLEPKKITHLGDAKGVIKTQHISEKWLVILQLLCLLIFNTFLS